MKDSFKLQDLCWHVQLSKSTIYLEMKRGNFPRPVKLTKKTNVWLKSDIDAWFKSKVDAAHGLVAEVAE